MKVVKRFNDRVSLYLRVRVNGKQQYIKVVWLNKQELKPGWGFLDGKPTECSSGVYHLRYRAAGKRIWEGDCGRFARHPPKSAGLASSRPWFCPRRLSTALVIGS